MTTKPLVSGTDVWTPIYGDPMKIIATGEVCELVEFDQQSKVFTLKTPNGNICEFHRRELDHVDDW